MAVPLYRPTGQSRRAVRNQQQFDHDVFEGLPIRRWNKQWMWFAKKNVPPPPPPELPLPKETHLLTPMSQTLLKAARNGTLGKPQDEEGAAAAADGAADGKKPSPGSTRLFKTNKWTVIPREDEPAEPEYLGRPPDTFTRHSRLVRKTVNGKVMIVEEDLEEMYAEAPVPGVAVDGVVASPAQPIKRRPPPPKRKPGRGRKPGFKKMVTFSEDGRALPTGEGHATPSGAAGAGGEGGEGDGDGDGDGEGDGEDDVEMGDAEDGTPDDQDDGADDGDAENDIEATPLEKTATPEITAAAAAAAAAVTPQVKKEGTVEPMDLASPTPVTAAAVPPIAEVVEETQKKEAKSPSPAPPAVIKEPTPEQAAAAAPAPVTEAPPSDPVPEPAPPVEAPAPTLKSPTPQPPPIKEEEEKEKPADSPPVNPLKRKSPPDEGEDELIDKDLEKHEVSIAAAVAERESHDETLSPAPPAPAAALPSPPPPPPAPSASD
ncbi:hypothetical protein TWF730_001381 [Orbilia blumenaviensis]|uniref:Uncharacterized protein n=1 Tax=Orbilia blumenaviensis TaxID=1796055 RepID=A0AAV9ULZ2_9PEZI